MEWRIYQLESVVEDMLSSRLFFRMRGMDELHWVGKDGMEKRRDINDDDDEHFSYIDYIVLSGFIVLSSKTSAEHGTEVTQFL